MFGAERYTLCTREGTVLSLYLPYRLFPVKRNLLKGTGWQRFELLFFIA